VTKTLARQEVFHQVEVSYPVHANGNTSTKTWPEKAAAYAALEHRITGILQVLGLKAVPATVGDDGLLDLDQARPQLDDMDKRVQQVRDEYVLNQKQLEQLRVVVEQLEPLTGVEADLSTLSQSTYLHTRLGIMPVANIDRLQTSLEQIPYVLVTLHQADPKAVVWLATSRQHADVLERAARSAYHNPFSLPGAYQGTPAEVVAALRADMAGIERQMAEQTRQLRQLADELAQPLQTLLWQVRVSHILAEAIGRFNRFQYTYLIDGWVPTSALADCAAGLQKIAPNIVIDTLRPKRGDRHATVPVALDNPRLLRPFQALVINYAQPLYHELDPTFVFALLFPFLFGAMFGDVGQGLVLVLLGALLTSRKVPALKSLGGMGGVVIACGLTATVFGFLYGSIFGFEDVLPALFLRPMDSILQTLTLAIGAGVALLSVGFLVNIFNAWTIRAWGHFFFAPHGVAGLALYWSLVALAVEVAAGQHPIPVWILGGLALVTGLAVMFTEVLEALAEGRQPDLEGSLPAYCFRALFELFETLIGLLSNSVSFVRVGAFAVAHVGLSAVIFILAGLASPGHGVGYALVIAFGNVFIIGFEGMIVGIQTMRLSYYEFFSKFFTGGGLRFEPLSLSPKTGR
jgi:V/A-type H+-transporting ATPase subunit I